MAARPLSRLQVADHLLESLNRLQRAWDARWRQICDEADVHPSQAQGLLFLAERGPTAMQELSRGLCIAPSTATRLVEQMEKVGWVARAGDPSDRRRVLIHLLTTGEDRAWTIQEMGREGLWPSAGRLQDPVSAIGSLDRMAQLLEPEE
jgi:DNA-binding MarR family transcriptional regulator